MSTIKERVHRKNASGTYDVLHFETEASIVYMSDGSTTVEEAIQARAPQSHTHTVSQITDFPSSMPASDVYSWAKQPNKPSYSYSEVGAAAASHTHNVTDISNALPISTVSSPYDLNNLLTPGVYTSLFDTGVNQTNYHTPYGEQSSGYSAVTHYNIFVFGSSTRLTQVAVSAFSHNRGYWWRVKHDSTWSSWFSFAYTDHTHTASQVTAGTLAGQVLANASAVATVTTAQVRNIYAGTADLTAGASGLTSGYIYLVYE